jgi:2',3'-cyclic-nucleotide 2'-phosphodiesterase/3'-nucleotidase
VPLHTFFGALPGNAALALVAEAQRAHVRHAISALPEAALPLLSAVAPFKMGGRGGPDYYTDVPAGSIAIRHVADLYAHPNAIRAVLVTGADLAEWLERAAALFCTLAPGRPDQPLIEPGVPSSSFDVIHGARWVIDLSVPARFGADGAATGAPAGRITGLTVAGRPVRPGDRFVVVTNSYRAEGGGGFPGTGAGRVLFASEDPVRDILRRHIARAGRVGGPAEPTFAFRPLPDTSAVFDTAPRAEAHRAALDAGLRVVPAGPAPGGFARFRLILDPAPGHEGVPPPPPIR